MIKRIIPLVVIMALVVPFLLFPASAAEFDNYYTYEELYHTVQLNEDATIVTVQVPLDTISFLFARAGNTGTYYDESNCFVFECAENVPYEIRIYSFSNRLFDIRDIPTGTEFTFDVSLDANIVAQCTGPDIRTAIYYYDINGIETSFKGISHDGIGLKDHYVLSQKMEKAPGYSFASFGVKMLNFIPKDDFTGSITVNSFQMKMSIASLYWQEMQTGKTNAILTEVEKQLEANGKKLDDVIDKIDQNGEKLDDVIDGVQDNGDKLDEIINGEVNPERPEGSDSVDDLGKLEDELLGSAQEGMDDYEVFIDESMSFIENHAQAFALMSIVFDSFLGVGWLHGIFVISLSLGIFGYLVNIAFKAAGDARSKGARAGKGGKGS